ncbi:hypothetical protein [Kribbella solani]|uniref:Secreted protein n=1 Tax=Kribbella solani TaxID=236067 RepID=A0A841DTK7_9ACTN|nr:hypothetical protein [Kribbella solani]MBB5980060.1 hypothetical protein [Kribbella solani]
MRIWTGLAAVTVLAVALSGCGAKEETPQVASADGASPSASASASGGAGPDDKAPLLKFSQCMRANGVPGYPDPKEGANGGVDLTVPEGTDPKKVEAATEKCKSHLPGLGEVRKPDAGAIAQLRKIAQCMRDNGITKFPDPAADGKQTDPTKLGIDPLSAEFQAAQRKCQPAGSTAGPQNQSNG